KWLLSFFVFIGKKVKNVSVNEGKSGKLFPGVLCIGYGYRGIIYWKLFARQRNISPYLIICECACYCYFMDYFTITSRFLSCRFLDDLTSHKRGPGFFTFVAGTSVFGSQLVVVGNLHSLAFYLWILSIILWVIIMYTFFFAVTVRKDKPSLSEGINGT